MFKVRTVSSIALLFLLTAFTATSVFAQSPSPSGKVSIDSTSVAAGIGVTWGKGKLSLDGKEYVFSIEGLTLVDFGLSKASAVGEVYNLTDVSKFDGNYVAGEVEFALAGGMGGMSLRNQNGVIIFLRSVSQGAKLQLGPAGMSITLAR